MSTRRLRSTRINARWAPPERSAERRHGGNVLSLCAAATLNRNERDRDDATHRAGYNPAVAGHVFISYLRDNADVVDQLVAGLRARGVSVWLDRDSIGLGQRWKGTIHEAIRSGHLFIACFSREYSTRDKSYMNEELTVAIEELRQRPKDRSWFIPVSLDGTDIPSIAIGAGETLQDLQRLDLSTEGQNAAEMIAHVATSQDTLASMSAESAAASVAPSRSSKVSALAATLSAVDQHRVAEAAWDAFIWSGESVPVAHAERKRLYAAVEKLGSELSATAGALKLEVETSDPTCGIRLGRHSIVLTWVVYASNFVAKSKLYVHEYDQPYSIYGGNYGRPEPRIVETLDFAKSSHRYGWRSGAEFRSSDELAERCVERLITHLAARDER